MEEKKDESKSVPAKPQFEVTSGGKFAGQKVEQDQRSGQSSMPEESLKFKPASGGEFGGHKIKQTQKTEQENAVQQQKAQTPKRTEPKAETKSTPKPSSSLFGDQPNANPKTGLFGQPLKSDQPATNLFGQPVVQPTTNLFGQPIAPGTNLFASTPTSNIFTAQPAKQVQIFGKSEQPGEGPKSNQPLFGKPPQPSESSKPSNVGLFQNQAAAPSQSPFQAMNSNEAKSSNLFGETGSLFNGQGQSPIKKVPQSIDQQSAMPFGSLTSIKNNEPKAVLGQNSNFKSPFQNNQSTGFNLQANAQTNDLTDTPARTLFKSVPAESLQQNFSKQSNSNENQQPTRMADQTNELTTRRSIVEVKKPSTQSPVPTQNIDAPAQNSLFSSGQFNKTIFGNKAANGGAQSNNSQGPKTMAWLSKSQPSPISEKPETQTEQSKISNPVLSDDTRIAAFTWAEIKRDAVKPDWFSRSNVAKQLDSSQKDLIKDLINWEQARASKGQSAVYVQNSKPAQKPSGLNKKTEISELKPLQESLNSANSSSLENSLRALRDERQSQEAELLQREKALDEKEQKILAEMKDKRAELGQLRQWNTKLENMLATANLRISKLESEEAAKTQAIGKTKHAQWVLMVIMTVMALMIGMYIGEVNGHKGQGYFGIEKN